MTWWNADNPNWNNILKATRDWTYSLTEVRNYADCWDSGRNCPGAIALSSGILPGRPAAQRDWDVPLNNAETYEQWILNKRCVSGDMTVDVKNEGVMQVKFLESGMKIRGQTKNRNAAWCEVQDVHFIGRGELHGNFTKGHLVFDPSTDEIVPNGNVTQ